MTPGNSFNNQHCSRTSQYLRHLHSDIVKTLSNRVIRDHGEQLVSFPYLLTFKIRGCRTQRTEARGDSGCRWQRKRLSTGHVYRSNLIRACPSSRITVLLQPKVQLEALILHIEGSTVVISVNLVACVCWAQNGVTEKVVLLHDEKGRIARIVECSIQVNPITAMTHKLPSSPTQRKGIRTN